jgi:hypothetical protein
VLQNNIETLLLWHSPHHPHHRDEDGWEFDGSIIYNRGISYVDNIMTAAATKHHHHHHHRHIISNNKRAPIRAM